MVVPRVWWEKRESELMFNGYRISSWEDKKVLEMDGGVMEAQHCGRT